MLELVTRMNIGGPARQVLALGRGIARTWPVVVAAGRPSDREGELVDPEVPVRDVPLVRPLHPVTDVRALVAVRRLLTDTAPLLVHTHMAKAGAVGRLAALAVPERPCTVHTFHGHVLEGYFGPLQQGAFVRLERFLAHHCDALVAVSPEVRDELVDLGIGTSRQFRVIPLGLDLAPYSAVAGQRGVLRAVLGLAAGVPLLGVLGRLVAIKDHGTLFAALASTPGAHLAVIGDGELRPELERAASRLGIADRVHFTGWWHQVPDALSDLDLVVLSSRNEGTPLALVEALAAGRPVVATDVGGVRHVVEDGRTGWLCAPGDPAALAVLIRRVLSDPAAALSLAAEGRRRVVERFGQERMVAEHRELYAELVRGEGGGRRIGV